ncbi:unnamed protein product, partial [Lepidochelys kempii]
MCRINTEPVFRQEALSVFGQREMVSGLTDDEDIKVMLKGSFLWKIKSRRRKTERFYRLQEDGLTILSESCFKRARSKQI